MTTFIIYIATVFIGLAALTFASTSADYYARRDRLKGGTAFLIACALMVLAIAVRP